MIPVAKLLGAMDFVVHGQPEPQRRPRFARQGLGVRTYPNQADVIYRQRVVSACHDGGAVDLGDGPVSMSIWACFARPKAHWTTSGDLSRVGRRSSHPTGCDLDNVTKQILDGLNGLAYRDDRQIVGIHATKFFQYTRDMDPFVQVHAQAVTNWETL